MLVSVALPLPLFRTFTYEVDDRDAARARPGMRAVVPFRNRRQIGLIVGEDQPREGIKAKRVESLPDAEPVMSAAMLDLCRWLADYYIVPLGVAIRTALPAALTSHESPEPSRRTRRVARIINDLPSLLQRDELFARSKQQRALFELLESLGGSAAIEHLSERLKFSPSVLKKLVDRELFAISDEVVARDPFAKRGVKPPSPHTPSAAQRTAIDQLVDAKPGSVFLLHGITGSGKTLVYIELLRRVVLERGKSAIVLVPEIALTPQTVDRFRAVFGDDIAVLHSALSDGERYDEWLALREGRKRIAVGARSAIFAPLENLGAIVVDEEHESSYKQGETPRYHARETAIVRAKHEGAVVVLGSATPSLESWVNASSGKYTLLTLPQRVGEAKLPRVDVIDRRETKFKFADERTPEDWLRLVISEELETALSDRLKKKEQSILLLNRRGYSSFVQCGTCGFVATCPNCSISLTHHRTPERLICHYCQHNEPLARACPRMRRYRDAAARSRHATGRAVARRPLSDGPDRAHGCRHDERQVGARGNSRPGWQRRGGHPPWHADDREGFRLSECDPGRRRRCGRRYQSAGLPRVGAVLPAAEPGRGPGGARTEGRPGVHPDACATASRGDLRRDARLLRLRPSRARRTDDATISAECASGQHRRERVDRSRDREPRRPGNDLAARACCASARWTASRSSDRRPVRSSASRIAGAGIC